MYAPSFLFIFFLVVSQILPLTLASPLASHGMSKRFCKFYACRVDGDPEPIAVGTWTPVPYQPSETSTAASTPTPVKQKLGADSKQGTDSVLEPSPALPSVSGSSSANAGVALDSYGSELSMALTGLLAIVLAI